MKKTKEKIIKITSKLFIKNGYEKTTIQEIIDMANISKGAFYHYFKTKEDILDTIADRYVFSTINRIDDVLENKELNALEKLNNAIIITQKTKEKQKEKRNLIKNAFKNDKNLKLQRKIFKKIKEKMIPRIKKIIEQGNKEKIFNVENSLQYCEFFFYNIFNMKESIEEILNLNQKDSKLKIIEKLDFYEDMFSKTMKIKKGKINLKQPHIIRIFKGDKK